MGSYNTIWRENSNTKFEIEHAETEMMLTRVVTLCNFAKPFFEFVILILHWQVESFVSFRKPVFFCKKKLVKRRVTGKGTAPSPRDRGRRKLKRDSKHQDRALTKKNTPTLLKMSKKVFKRLKTLKS